MTTYGLRTKKQVKNTAFDAAQSAATIQESAPIRGPSITFHEPKINIESTLLGINITEFKE